MSRSCHPIVAVIVLLLCAVALPGCIGASWFRGDKDRREFESGEFRSSSFPATEFDDTEMDRDRDELARISRESEAEVEPVDKAKKRKSPFSWVSKIILPEGESFYSERSREIERSLNKSLGAGF